MNTLLTYDWPGNVRELRTAIEHGVVMATGPKITFARSAGERAAGDRRAIAGAALHPRKLSGKRRARSICTRPRIA